MGFRVPKYCLHKASGRAYVKIRGKRTYLGTFGTPESREEYQKLIAQMERLYDSTGQYRTTLKRLCVEFLKYADGYYRGPDGKPTPEVASYKPPIRLLLSMFGNELCAEFGPKKLIALRDEFAKKHVRTIANRQTYRIRRIIKWGVSREMVPPEVLVKLQTVEGLQFGRCAAKESKPVKPVSTEHIEATLPYLTSPVAAMVRLQIVTGARPSEVRVMTPGEIDQSGDVWIYKPTRHKNAWRGKSRTILIGPRGQDILFPFLLGRKPDEFLFRPIEGREEYVQKAFRDGARVAVRNAGEENTPYRLSGYLSSIRRACKRANIPVWTPGQLRHNAATLINKQFGDLDASRVMLGHSEKSTTQIYAERDLAKAAEIAKAMG